MLRLNMTGERRWYDMAPGVRFLLSPCTSTVLGMAREADSVQVLIESEASETELTVALAKEVAYLTVEDWEGVGDDDGNLVPVSPAGIDALLEIWPVFEAFQAQYVARGLMLDQEKNVSAPSPTGPSAGATATARPAHPARAPGASAPTAPQD